MAETASDRRRREWLEEALRKGHVLRSKEPALLVGVDHPLDRIDTFVHRGGEHCMGPACTKCGDTWCYLCTDKSDVPECSGIPPVALEDVQRADAA